MQKYKNPIANINEDELGRNPFSFPLKIEVNSTILNNQFKLEGDIKVPVEVEYEKTPFVKVYAKSEHRLIMMKLKPTSLKVFMWIFYTIPHSKDYLWINKKRCMEECSMSLNTFKASIIQLERYGMISPISSFKYKDTFWINPEFFFKGSRINKYPDNIVEYIPKSTNSKYTMDSTENITYGYKVSNK